MGETREDPMYKVTLELSLERNQDFQDFRGIEGKNSKHGRQNLQIFLIMSASLLPNAYFLALKKTLSNPHQEVLLLEFSGYYSVLSSLQSWIHLSSMFKIYLNFLARKPMKPITLFIMREMPINTFRLCRSDDTPILFHMLWDPKQWHLLLWQNSFLCNFLMMPRFLVTNQQIGGFVYLHSLFFNKGLIPSMLMC